MRLPGEKSRDRYVEDWEIIEVLALPSKRKKGSILMLQAYIRLKLLTGLARSDLLRLDPTTGKNLTPEGICVTRHKTAEKTGKTTLYEWTPELRAAVDLALSLRPVDIAPFIFCTNKGAGYLNEVKGTASGWDLAAFHETS